MNPNQQGTNGFGALPQRDDATEHDESMGDDGKTTAGGQHQAQPQTQDDGAGLGAE